MASFHNISQFVTDNCELKFSLTRSGNNVETIIYIKNSISRFPNFPDVDKLNKIKSLEKPGVLICFLFSGF